MEASRTRAAPAGRADPAAPHAGPAAAHGALALIEAMRPRQWTKNVFVLAALVFAGRLFEADEVARALACLVAFCAASSAVYLVNDVADRWSDALHPAKRARPVASGRLAPLAALGAAAVLGLGAALGALAISRETFGILSFYLILSGCYSLGLKRVFILDVLIVAAGFVLRAAAGAAAVEAEISPWLLCCTFLLALFLALGKRRHELSLLGDGAVDHRQALGSYSTPLLDSWLSALSGATIVSYALYTQSERTVANFRTTNLVYTVPFVVYALFRYQHLVLREGGGGDPGSSLIHDRGVMVALAGWAASAAFIIYSR
ncbi:MAG: decaprenyl-phosphate phosphoribosyltransferase [Myxococcales bacterium]